MALDEASFRLGVAAGKVAYGHLDNELLGKGWHSVC